MSFWGFVGRLIWGDWPRMSERKWCPCGEELVGGKCPLDPCGDAMGEG